MQKRTVEDLHDKNYGHRKMAKIVDLLLAQNYKVTEIKEFNEQFKFRVNGHLFWYRKEWKSSAKDFAIYIINILKTEESLLKHDNTWRF